MTIHDALRYSKLEETILMHCCLINNNRVYTKLSRIALHIRFLIITKFCDKFKYESYLSRCPIGTYFKA